MFSVPAISDQPRQEAIGWAVFRRLYLSQDFHFGFPGPTSNIAKAPSAYPARYAGALSDLGRDHVGLDFRFLPDDMEKREAGAFE